MACGCSKPGQTTTWQHTSASGTVTNMRTEIEAMAKTQREGGSYTPVVK